MNAVFCLFIFCPFVCEAVGKFHENATFCKKFDEPQLKESFPQCYNDFYKIYQNGTDKSFTMDKSCYRNRASFELSYMCHAFCVNTAEEMKISEKVEKKIFCKCTQDNFMFCTCKLKDRVYSTEEYSKGFKDSPFFINFRNTCNARQTNPEEEEYHHDDEDEDYEDEEEDEE